MAFPNWYTPYWALYWGTRPLIPVEFAPMPLGSECVAEFHARQGKGTSIVHQGSYGPVRISVDY